MNLTHNLSGISVNQRAIDGYINATALASAHKESTGKRKDVAEWLKTKRTQETLEHLNSITGIPVIELYQVFGGVLKLAAVLGYTPNYPFVLLFG